MRGFLLAAVVWGGLGFLSAPAVAEYLAAQDPADPASGVCLEAGPDPFVGVSPDACYDAVEGTLCQAAQLCLRPCAAVSGGSPQVNVPGCLAQIRRPQSS